MLGLRRRLALESAYLNGADDQIASNREQEPIPPDSVERTWTWPSLLGFWVAEAFSISMYQVSSSSVSKGLNPGLSILAVLIGHFLVCIPAILDGWVGATFGINFPIFTRASFGMRGSYFAVFIRGVVAVIWFGTQSFQGGQCLQVMISAIWPSFNRFPNHIPESSHVTSAQLLCFFLFIIVQAPLLWLKVSSLRYMFMAKTVIMPIFGLTLFIWALVAAKGFGPTFSKPTHIKDGTSTAVVFLQCVTTAIGPKATLALNMPDFTRYAKKRSDVIWTQAVGLMVLVTMCGVLGATVSSATEVIYGKTTWNPLEVAVLWNNRAAQFFAGLCWMFAVIGTNISANSVSFSNDLALWFPKYINARRGAYVCCILSIACTPWNIQYNAKSFSSFLGGYSLFLGALAGVIVTDFWICRRRSLDVRELYKKHSVHSFTKGFNFRAFVAFFCGIAPDLPGLAAACGAKGVPVGAKDLYSLSWLVAIIISGAVYWALWKIFPFEVSPSSDMYVDGIEDRSDDGVTKIPHEVSKKDFD
ncbi:hypothetical protein AAFC00_005802 [Neodothiora populina]|uniref:NCS1 nucleoside transporter n=1 Tax=Neodothiora populina TaxID=2781224 RepID=A0ABR3P658_9PEZI